MSASYAWRARAEGLADSLEEVWRRGVGFVGLDGFDATQDRAAQLHAFDRRFRPWLYEPGEGGRRVDAIEDGLPVKVLVHDPDAPVKPLCEACRGDLAREMST